jgi:hypothetical protein
MPGAGDDVASGPSRFRTDADADASWLRGVLACDAAAEPSWTEATPCGGDDDASAIAPGTCPDEAADDACDAWWSHAVRACADAAVERRRPCGDADDEQDSCCALGASDAWP